MRSFLALMRREYLEHRVAFVYAPLVLVLLLALFILASLLGGRIETMLPIPAGTPAKFYEAIYFVVAGLWWCYLAALLFFYFADAYNSDTRNNAMLFWKSMPQGDFKILMSKLMAGVTVFPVLIFLAAMLSGIVIMGVLQFPHAGAAIFVPALSDLFGGWLRVSAVLFVYLVLALLWCLPFFAWVGALSTFVGRWAVPLAIAVPLLLSAFERTLALWDAPGGSYVWSYLRGRIDFRYDSAPLLAALFSPGPIDVPATVRALLAGYDWLQMLYGLIFALLVVYVASRYRRRVIKG